MMRFPLGQLVSTPGALSAIEDRTIPPLDFVSRHASGDWGEVDADDKRANDQALIDGERLLSAYRTKRGERLWVITEADRNSTCTYSHRSIARREASGNTPLASGVFRWCKPTV